MTEAVSAQNLAERLVVTSEEVLLGMPKQGRSALAKVGGAFFATLAGPAALVTRGLTQLRRRTVVVVVVLFVVGTLVNATMSSTLPRDWLSQINTVWAMLTVGALLLPSPSDVGFGVYDSQEFDRAYARLDRLVTLPQDAIEPHRQFIQRAEERSLQRLSTLKWLLAATWAVALYLGQQGFEKKDGELLGTAMIPLLIAIFAAGIVVCYGRGVNAVFSLAIAMLAQRAVDIAQARPVHPPRRAVRRCEGSKARYRSRAERRAEH
jgi:hypothetical protein